MCNTLGPGEQLLLVWKTRAGQVSLQLAFVLKNDTTANWRKSERSRCDGWRLTVGCDGRAGCPEGLLGTRAEPVPDPPT